MGFVQVKLRRVEENDVTLAFLDAVARLAGRAIGGNIDFAVDAELLGDLTGVGNGQPAGASWR